MNARALVLLAATGLLSACPNGSNQNNNPLPSGDPDAGTPDTPFDPPDPKDWTLLDTGAGGPQRVYGASVDEGGNLWVAGGEEGLFLRRAGSSTFERFTLAHGLHPWAEPAAGQGSITRTYLNVASVAGGPAGTVYVGYLGMPPSGGELGCEDNWDGPNPDPNLYKSGDADKVTLAGSGLTVTHYDISSPAGAVAAEPRGREKICDVYRIAYDPRTESVWFGGNHAFAWGDPAGGTVHEHAHPLLNGYLNEGSTSLSALSNYYWGLALGTSGDVWIGGLFRSQHCVGGQRGLNFYDCESEGADLSKQFDWWPDQIPTDSRPSQRVDDAVSGMAVAADGTLWIGSFTNGLARRAPDGAVSFVSEGLSDPKRIHAVQVDPLDGSVWVGHASGGLSRIRGNQSVHYGSGVLPGGPIGGPVNDIQIDRSGDRRRVIVSFRNGAVGIYGGP